MHISEAYEHEPIRPCKAEDACQPSGCNKVGTQCVDVSAPLILTPTAAAGTVTVACQGTPDITCVTDAGGTSCTVTMTQRVCVSVPIRYGVNLTSGEPTIACAESCAGSGCC
nr:hypothetical protein [uncultured Oscillibacter sp.]